MKKRSRRLLGRTLARRLDDRELLAVYGGRAVVVAQDPDYTSTVDSNGVEID